MKYTVKFSCGHTDVVDLVGPVKDRERKIQYYEDCGLCPDCYAMDKELKKAKGCVEKEMKYYAYKKYWYWCDTKRDSYDSDNKTIIVYVPENVVGYEDILEKMAENVKNMSRNDSVSADAALLKGLLEKGVSKEEVTPIVCAEMKMYRER